MAIFAAFSHAAPLEIEARNFRVWVTFQGAPPEVAYYTRSIPADGSVYYIGTFNTTFYISPFFFSIFSTHGHSPCGKPF